MTWGTYLNAQWSQGRELKAPKQPSLNEQKKLREEIIITNTCLFGSEKSLSQHTQQLSWGLWEGLRERWKSSWRYRRLWEMQGGLYLDKWRWDEGVGLWVLFFFFVCCLLHLSLHCTCTTKYWLVILYSVYFSIIFTFYQRRKKLLIFRGSWARA